MAGSISLPIVIPTSKSGSAERTDARLAMEGVGADRPLGGSLPAGAFGMSPTESAK